jgi:hypothetical protein
MREQIIAEIKRIAEEIGRPPGKNIFQERTGIKPYSWNGVYWVSWGDALKEAGFQPNSLQGKTDPNLLLAAVSDVTLSLGHFPTHAELTLQLRNRSGPNAKNVQSQFPRRHMLVDALRLWASGEDGNEAVLDLLPELTVPMHEPEAQSELGHVYLLRSGDYFKIGRSSDLEKRVKSISVALPDKVILEHSISTDDPPGIEAYWHKRFADRRANGEWFKLTKSDVLAFKKRKFQ